jgi:hypothetical protein
MEVLQIKGVSYFSKRGNMILFATSLSMLRSFSTRHPSLLTIQSTTNNNFEVSLRSSKVEPQVSVRDKQQQDPMCMSSVELINFVFEMSA